MCSLGATSRCSCWVKVAISSAAVAIPNCSIVGKRLTASPTTTCSQSVPRRNLGWIVVAVAISREQPVTAHRRWRLLIPAYILLAIIALIGIIGAILGLVLLWQLAQNRTPYYADIVEEFKYGS